MSFILYELARNEECQDRAHQEIIEVLQHHDNKISFDALNEMTYLECAVFGIVLFKIENFETNEKS